MDLNMMNSKVPSLRQNDSSFQRYRNPLNEQRNRSESNSFEKKNPEMGFPIQPPYMYYASTPIYPVVGDGKGQFDQSQLLKIGNTNSLACLIQQQQLQEEQQQNEFKLNQTTYGCKILCQVDCHLVERYFNQKYWIFQNSNQKYKLDRNKLNNQDWIKNRVQHRYKPSISEAFLEMIDEVVKEGEIQMNVRKDALKMQNAKVFQNLERQIPKQVKLDKQFDCFLLDIQKCLAEFIFTSFDL